MTTEYRKVEFFLQRCFYTRLTKVKRGASITVKQKLLFRRHRAVPINENTGGADKMLAFASGAVSKGLRGSSF